MHSRAFQMIYLPFKIANSGIGYWIQFYSLSCFSSLLWRPPAPQQSPCRPRSQHCQSCCPYHCWCLPQHSPPRPLLHLASLLLWTAAHWGVRAGDNCSGTLSNQAILCVLLLSYPFPPALDLEFSQSQRAPHSSSVPLHSANGSVHPTEEAETKVIWPVSLQISSLYLN